MEETLVWIGAKCPHCQEKTDWDFNIPLRCPNCSADCCLKCAKIKDGILICHNCGQKSQIPKSVKEDIQKVKTAK